jgi:heme exporter protein A
VSVISSVLRAEGLRFCYPQRDLFSELSLGILPGVTLVRGGEGCGKTTLLRLLAGVLPAQAGILKVNEIRLIDRPEAYRQEVFWVDPRSDAFDQITPADYWNSLHQQHSKFDDSLLSNLVTGLSLAPHMNKPMYMLSTGSKRKVWLAAAFASGATVTLLDDPFAALDKVSITYVLGLLETAATHVARAWVVAHYEPLHQVPLAAIIDLGD